MQIPGHLTEKLLDRLTSVVTGDVRVDFAPKPFDVVVFGTIGWQEMKTEDPPCLPQVLLDPSAGVDAVVIQDQMDSSSPRMVSPKSFQQRQEQIAVLPKRPRTPDRCLSRPAPPQDSACGFSPE